MFDPIGPGTPAWDQFDKAIIAWRKYESLPRAHHDRRKTNKSYFNHRAQLQGYVIKHGGDWSAWDESLKTMRDDYEYEI